MIQAKKHLQQALDAVLVRLSPPDAPVRATLELPRQAAHGDFAITAAMALARPLRQPPREVAQALVAALEQEEAFRQHVESMELAGPGFINLRLKAASRQAVIAEVLAATDAFGHQPPHEQRVMVEFVSANPTGPLHVGHARQAALGDSLCRLFATQGWQVAREFYYNDAGAQIHNLALSVQARLRGHEPGSDEAPNPDWPKDGYRGEYIMDIAREFAARASVQADDRSTTASGDADDLDSIREFAVAYLRREQDLDLRAFDLRFDRYFLESSLYTSGQVEATVSALVAAGHTFEQDGALWLRTTDYGDDKDRVMRKADGSGYTYFVPDVAYHVDKFRRGYHKVINVQGTDHHGTIARVRAGLQALDIGVPGGFPDYVLHKMVKVMRGGQEVKLSKRAGSYVTLRDLVEMTSKDAVRFFLVSRKADTEYVFDVDLAVQHSDDNPVFYVQYAHARICSVLAQYAARTGLPADVLDAAWLEHLRSADLALLTDPLELALMSRLAEFPDMLTRASVGLTPHDVAFYLRDLAASFHSTYGGVRFLVDDATLAAARMALLWSTAQVCRNALQVLGVSAPQRLERAAAPD
ncbi:arginine--tRNA ligase [Amphibiibacter pelophylacis]|uniref:Arginine--tRNA ligase n=1 Tax=Amphibiibacter pelophylacis TaxID=1799477 RepID=A0ACC6P0P1_9BURK